MDLLSGDLVKVFGYLLPGFLAAAIFYGLTAHPKSSPFERVVQALIFTIIVQCLVTILRWITECVGQYWSLGEWTPSVAQFWSVVIAAIVGVGVAAAANHNFPHSLLHRIKATKRTWHPTEWYTAFADEERYVTLHLEGERRLRGWPLLWPDQADTGHFIIVEPAWMLSDNTILPIHTVHSVLISATSVEMVEFMNWPEEITVEQTEIDRIEKKLVDLQTPKKEDTENGQ